MKHIPVKEIMISLEDYLTVNQFDTVKDAIQKLQSSFKLDNKGIATGHTSLLVVNDKGHLVGLLTIRGILKALVMHEESKEIPSNFLWTLFVSKSYKTASEIPVRRIMRDRHIFSIGPEEDIMKAVQMIVANKVNALPVVEKGKAVGIIRSKDIFGMIGDLIDNTDMDEME
ncbi:CBS domain containing protein [Desulforamulus reducens MI-1]|uniref:CBS domain containing protein n=1 Tax=Desulforamulus reducens (strain ATCC BAA-1160 / DSM 100696 / MI-1) TaxID=349161 RepID=A4J4Y2_DESRM|nr:CBS domain-containing protein [Desulforamulus reducens]ABO50135.1 CBS domain containing protein [Desulforamulus reducens MI-1]